MITHDAGSISNTPAPRSDTDHRTTAKNGMDRQLNRKALSDLYYVNDLLVVVEFGPRSRLERVFLDNVERDVDAEPWFIRDR